jgi:hypothetical protein
MHLKAVLLVASSYQREVISGLPKLTLYLIVDVNFITYKGPFARICYLSPETELIIWCDGTT